MGGCTRQWADLWRMGSRDGQIKREPVGKKTLRGKRTEQREVTGCPGKGNYVTSLQDQNAALATD